MKSTKSVLVVDKSNAARDGIGVVVNEFQGFYRISYRKVTVGETTTLCTKEALAIDSVWEKYCEELSVEWLKDQPDCFVVSNEELNRARAEVTAGRYRSMRYKEGTLEHLWRASSPLPMYRYNRALYELKLSELCLHGHVRNETFNGLFAVKQLPPDWYVGEYLGKLLTVDESEQSESMYKMAVFRNPSHHPSGEKISKGGNSRVDYDEIVWVLDAAEAHADVSSFVRFVNAPTLWKGRFQKGEVGPLTDERPGFENCEFVQIGKRVHLRTTRTVPAGKELLVRYGHSYELPECDALAFVKG
ncbi:hypothetical protein DIPPA_06406 [Diplonema papillatum]|nr:hypothetical protein DIPPA_06406 [Diplonema papillatum]